MPSKLDWHRYESARSQLKEDLELAHLLLSATPEMVDNLEYLKTAALSALAKTSNVYLAAAKAIGNVKGLYGETESAASSSMRTEDLMRLTAEMDSAEPLPTNDLSAGEPPFDRLHIVSAQSSGPESGTKS